MAKNFLLDQLRDSIGVAWLNNETAESSTTRHPIAEWYLSARALLEEDPHEPKRTTHPPTMHGAMAACYSLANDLCSLKDDRLLLGPLVERLRSQSEFSSARYEVYIAAALVRAGFAVEFEHGETPLTSHCEFTATCFRTGSRFSIEAKRRGARPDELGMVTLFTMALAKQANYRRIIFLDWNRQYEEASAESPHYVRDFVKRLRHLEGKQVSVSASSRSAYLVLTNTPWEHYLGSTLPSFSLQLVGFQVPEFPRGAVPRLRDSAAEGPHVEVHRLVESLDRGWQTLFTSSGELSQPAAPRAARRMIAVV